MPEFIPDAPVTAFIGLGSNLGPGPSRLRAALADLDRLPRTRVNRCSDWYRSAPMGHISQPAFTNGVARVHTRLAPRVLLRELHRIERCHGRVRKLRWGPRTLDLDLLVYDAAVMDDPDLRLPHPGIAGRLFVLQPLFDIDPGLAIPEIGTLGTLLRRCPGPVPRRLA